MTHKMKQTMILAAVLVPMATSAGVYHIAGQLTDRTQHRVYLSRYTDKAFTVVDSATVRNGRFGFDGKVPSPLLYGLSTDREDSRPLAFFLEEGTVRVRLDERQAEIHVSGSRADSLYRGELPKLDRKGYPVDSLIAAHPASVVPAYLLIRYFAWNLNLSQLKTMRAKFAPQLDRVLYVQQVDSLVAHLQRVEAGQPAPDFALPDTAGVMVNLKDFRGKYVLVDFWASWCGDCRREMPLIRAIHEKYKDLVILGVSFDRNRRDWLGAIRRQRLHWTQVSDLKGWGSSVTPLYSVCWIPTVYLIGPDGKIIDKALTLVGFDPVLETHLQP